MQARVEDLEKQNISLDSLPPDDVAKLRNLREIDNYLGRAIDEYQKILNNHFDLKAYIQQSWKRFRKCLWYSALIYVPTFMRSF